MDSEGLAPLATMTTREHDVLEALVDEGDRCVSCNMASVVWRLAARGPWLEHDGGRASCRFPCSGTCRHLDCADARVRLGERDLRRELEEILG